MAIDTYISSKGEKTKISEMANPHLIHSIAKLAKKIGAETYTGPEAEEADEEMLVALKTEAIERLSEVNPE